MALKIDGVDPFFGKMSDAFLDALQTERVKVDPGAVYDPFRFIAEGRGRLHYWRATNWAVSQPAVVAGDAQSLGPVVVCRPGRKIFLTSNNFSLSGAGQVECVLDTDALSSGGAGWTLWGKITGSIYGDTRFWESFGTNGGNSNNRTDGHVLNENSVLNGQYRSKTTTGLDCSINFWGVEIPNEPNMDAEIKIGIVGDSTAQGANLGPDANGRAYLGSFMWSEKFRDLARAAGVDCQIFFNDAEDGKTMLEGAYRLLTGYTRTKVDVLFISFGMNDASSVKHPTEAVFKEAANYYITERNRWNPGCKLVFMMPNLSDDPDRITANRLANVRTWVQDVATAPGIAGTANNVYLFDQATAISLGNADYKEQVAGTYVHPNGLGSSKIGVAAWNALKAPLFGK